MTLCLSTLLFAQTNGGSWWNSEYNTTEGTDFWVTFMCNSGAKESDDKNMELFLYFTARETTTVTISNPILRQQKTEIISAGQQKKVKIDNNWGYLEDSVPSNKGIHIVATKPISVYSTSHHSSGKYDGSNIIPTNALASSYVIQTYLRDQYATEFAIVATTNQTININLKETILDQSKFESTKNPTLDTINTINKLTSITLGEGQAYLIRSSSIMGSLSGTTLCSDHPFALFQGGQSVMIPKAPENHIFHNGYPTDLYGKTFVVTPTHDAVYDYIRITAAENNTDISRDGVYITTLQAFETFQDTLISPKYYLEDGATKYYTPTPAIYTTSKPTECYLYGTSNAINGPYMNLQAFLNKNSNLQTTYDYGSPVMTSIVPQELGMHSCIFATFADITQNEMKHYVNIVTPTSEVDGMRLDNRSIADEFKQVPSNNNYSFATIEIPDSAHYLENTRNNSNSTFTARVYGLGKSSSGPESYAYSAGSRVSRSADLLIDGEYIKGKEICIIDPVTFTPIINYDYDNYYFRYSKTDNTNYPITNSFTNKPPTDFEHTFSDAGTWEVDLIVERTTPICDLLLRDTIRTYIVVYDTIHLNYGYNDGPRTNICYGERFNVHYNNGTKYSYIADTTTVQEIYGKQQTFKLNHTYTFTDTIANAPMCDSIITQTVCIRPNYEYTVYDTICQKEAPYTYVDPITGKANTGKLSNLTKSGDYTDYLQTKYGCDSIIHLHLLINPDYRIPTTKKTICSTQDFYWQNKHYVGENFPTPSAGDIVVESGKTHYDSINYPTSALHHCDSIHTLALTVKDNLTDTIPATTCVHVPLSPMPDFNLSKFPDFTVDKVGTQVYIDSLTTIEGCDSIVTFILNVLPRYDTLHIDTICQHPTETYTWEHHTGYDILDSINDKHIRTIPRNESGWYTYIDHQYTKTGQCDSIHTLRLYVAPTYSFLEPREMCDNDSIH